MNHSFIINSNSNAQQRRAVLLLLADLHTSEKLGAVPLFFEVILSLSVVLRTHNFM